MVERFHRIKMSILKPLNIFNFSVWFLQTFLKEKFTFDVSRIRTLIADHNAGPFNDFQSTWSSRSSCRWPGTTSCTPPWTLSWGSSRWRCWWKSSRPARRGWCWWWSGTWKKTLLSVSFLVSWYVWYNKSWSTCCLSWRKLRCKFMQWLLQDM